MSHGVKAVKYIGPADIREITDEQWSQIGVRGQQTTIWNQGNGWTILGERFSDEAIGYFASDQGFALIREESTA